MTAPRERPAKPRNELEERATALRASTLEALMNGRRTTKQVVALIGDDPQAVYRALLSLQKAGQVDSVREHHPTVHGVPGRIWWRTDVRAPVALPPQDPLLWALFRRPDQATP